MYYYESPQTVPPEFRRTPSVFMAGGITDCPDWQRELRDMLFNTDLTLFNPRRANFPIDDPKAAEAQIKWEHTHLHRANAISFWFPAETLCPIVLFELGAWSHWGKAVWSDSTSGNRLPVSEPKPIFVGVHPDYKRKQDVEIQLRLQRPEVKIVSSIFDLAMQLKEWDRAQAKK